MGFHCFILAPWTPFFFFTSLIFVPVWHLWAWAQSKALAQHDMRRKYESKDGCDDAMTRHWRDSPSALCSGTLLPSWCLTRPFPHNPLRVPRYILYGRSSPPDRVHAPSRAGRRRRKGRGEEKKKKKTGKRERERGFRPQLWTGWGVTHHLACFLHFNCSLSVFFGLFHIFLSITYIWFNVVHKSAL